MINKVIFTFWEPEGTMPSYVALCRKTWNKNLSDFEIIDLNYSTLYHYISKGSLDLDRLKKLPYPMQKDAIMVAVLKHNSGIFMDADTLILNTLQPIFRLLEQTDIILFNTHLGFMAANARSVILNDWLERIKKDLRELSTPINTTENLGWDYIGNRNLANIMIKMVNDHNVKGISRLTVLNLLNAIIDRLRKINLINSTKISGHFNRIQTAIKYRKIDFVFKGDLKKHLWMLDRNSYGFIAEAAYYGSKIKDPQAQYEQFWFNHDRELDMVFSNSKTIIGLHNSWTPGWYKKLNEHDVFEDKSLLSRTIKHILKN